MKKLIAALFSLFLWMNTNTVVASMDIPDEFNVTEHWISLTTSFDIASKTEKLGTLYRKFFSLLLTYEFFDPDNNKIATARSRFFSWTAHFDVYDNKGAVLGVADERLFAFFPTFDIYDKTSTIRRAHAKMNFWGTTFTLYDPITDQEMANMHRSFLRFKNDWTFTVVNRPLLMQKNIDPRVLMTVIAFQGDREYWERNSQNFSLKAKTVGVAAQPAPISQQQVTKLLAKVNAISKKEGLTAIKTPDQTSLEALANELEADYRNSRGNDFDNETNRDEVDNFIDYCLSFAQANGVSDSKKQTIIYLLKMRLQSGVN